MSFFTPRVGAAAFRSISLKQFDSSALAHVRRLATTTSTSPSSPPPQITGTNVIPAHLLESHSVAKASGSGTPDLRTALSFLRQQPSHYVVASLYGSRYLLAPRDLLTVPRIKNVAVGEVLSLDKVHELGSRDYTLRGDPYLERGVVSVKATVVEHTKGAMERIVKKKRRKGYKKTIEHKQTYTRLRIGDIVIDG